MRFGLQFILAAALLAASSVPAAADPISISILTILSIEATATAVAITTFIITTAAAYALSAAASALNGGKRSAALQDANQFGIKSTLQSGGTVSRTWGFGLYMTAGSEVYPARTWGQSGKTPNAYFTRFIALSDLPVDGLNAIIVDDQLCTYGSGSPDADLGYAIPEYNSGGADHLWVKFYDGTQTAADAWAVSQFGSDPDYPYGSDQVGYGVAYAIVTALIEQTLFSSFPQFKFELQGAKLYDPRADSTVGGSGSQRWATSSTWAYTTNPAVVKYNVLRGISWDGQWLYGLQGTSSGRLPLDSWFAAMNVDDASVESSPAVFEAQYRCGGEVVVSSQPADLLDELNKCDNGRIAEAGGIFKTRSGAVGSAVMSFTDADLIVTEAKTFDPFPGLETTINGITATYPDPAQNWVMTDAPALYDSDLEAEDGDRRLVTSIPYNFVPYQSQVQRLMQSSRDEARRFRKHAVVAPPTAFALEALDVISWTSDENGYTNKLFSVVPTDQDNLDQGLALLEVDPADYDWDPSIDYRAYTPVPMITRAPASQTMTGWAVAGVTISGAGGRAKPGIQFTWGTSGITDVDGVLYQVRRASDSVLILAGETDHFSDGSLTVSENLSSATNYEGRGKYRPASANRETSWSSWLSVTTPDVQIVGAEIADGSITALKFAAGITQVQVVSSLATAITGPGAVAVLTTDSKLYRWNGSAWTAAVPTLDLTGTITAGQIDAGAIDITKVANSLAPPQVVSSLASATTYTGATALLTTDMKLYRYNGSAWIKTVDGGDITASTITGGSIVAGAIGATQIAAGAISASKMFIGSTDNLVLDGLTNDTNYWVDVSSSHSVIVAPSSAWVSATIIQLLAVTSTLVGVYQKPVACQPGDEFYLSALLGTNGVIATVDLVAIAFDNSGAILSGTVVATATSAGGPDLLSGNFTVPAGAAYIALEARISGTSTGNSLRFSTPVLRRRATGSLIVDGAITATKIGAGEIVAGKIAAGAVQAGNIAANAVQAGNVDADAITAGAIAAGAVNATAIIVSDIIVTGHIQANQISASSVSVGSSTAIASGAGYTTLTSVTKTLGGTGDVLVSFTDYITWSVNGPRGFYRVIDDLGNVILTANGYGGGSCPDFITSAGSGLDTNGRSGSVTYYLQANWTAGANQPTSQKAALVVTELKK